MKRRKGGIALVAEKASADAYAQVMAGFEGAASPMRKAMRAR